MKILGISAFYHDSSAVIIVDGKIIAASQEERYTRKKHDARFPTHAIQFCLEESGLLLNDLDAIIFYDKPFLKFERLLETYYAFVPRGIRSFIKAIPVWLKEKIFIKKIIFDELSKIEKFDRKKIKLLFSEHHLSHAASSFFASPFSDAAILTIDGVGEWTTTSIAEGKNNEIKILKEIHFPHSIGLLYSAFTYFLGFKVNSGEYKLMGLAPYGNPNDVNTKKYIEDIKNNFVTIYDDGSIWLNQKYFNYATGLTMIQKNKWEKILNIKKREPSEKIEQHHCNIALAIQKIAEEIILKLVYHTKKITQKKNLCLAGGVALNCVANGKIIQENIFDNVFIQPASGDAGGALGAAFVAHHFYFNQERKINQNDLMQGAFLGNSYHDFEIQKMIKKHKAQVSYHEEKELLDIVTNKIIEGKVIGWFQGKMEFGPRALGARSILGDPRNETMQEQINLKIKYRESFRPFAPIVLEEDANLFFDIKNKSPYMLEVYPLKKELLNDLPKNYQNLSIKEKLKYKRSTLPAITHVDCSARIQTVNKKINPIFWKLLNTFKNKTGIGMLINTSFNVRGEPIVCSPFDAYSCFMNTEMDVLVIENYLFLKEEQRESNIKKKEFQLD